jgi:hypothetical protein
VSGEKSEPRFVRTIVVLIRNTTWRCGRLERLIVKRLHNRRTLLGKPEMPIGDMLQNFKVSGKKKSEFLDAIRRLERRNIIRILKPVG